MHLALNASDLGRQRGGNETYLLGLLEGLAEVAPGVGARVSLVTASEGARLVRAEPRFAPFDLHDAGPYRRLPYGERGETLFVIQDTAAATQNLLLAATALGLGACWVGLFDEQMVKEGLELPRQVRPVALVPIGRTKSKARPKTRKPLEDVLHYERWRGSGGGAS